MTRFPLQKKRENASAFSLFHWGWLLRSRYNRRLCPDGEIGRHKRLKISRPHGRTGSIPVPGTRRKQEAERESLCSGSITRTDGCSHGRYRYRLLKVPIPLRPVHLRSRASFGGLCSTASPLQAWLRKRDRISGDLCRFVDRNEQALPISFRSIRGS